MIFHLVMTAAAMYMAMLLSNWGVDADAFNAGNSDLLTVSNESLWVKISSQWVTILVSASCCARCEMEFICTKPSWLALPFLQRLERRKE